MKAAGDVLIFLISSYTNMLTHAHTHTSAVDIFFEAAEEENMPVFYIHYLSEETVSSRLGENVHVNFKDQCSIPKTHIWVSVGMF